MELIYVYFNSINEKTQRMRINRTINPHCFSASRKFADAVPLCSLKVKLMTTLYRLIYKGFVKGMRTSPSFRRLTHKMNNSGIYFIRLEKRWEFRWKQPIIFSKVKHHFARRWRRWGPSSTHNIIFIIRKYSIQYISICI